MQGRTEHLQNGLTFIGQRAGQEHQVRKQLRRGEHHPRQNRPGDGVPEQDSLAHPQHTQILIQFLDHVIQP
ncbi:hypothetical protein D3C85_1863680 [compost metagenome]